MNNHSITNYNNPYPQGFNGTDCRYCCFLIDPLADMQIVLIDPGTYIYYNATMQSNTDSPRNLPGQYSTDVVAQRAVDFMKAGTSAGRPFFLTVAPIGPHTQTVFPFTAGNPSTLPRFDPPVPADRHKDKCPGLKVPRTSSYNPDLVCYSQL